LSVIWNTVVILDAFRVKDNKRAFMSRQEYRDFMREFGLGGSKIKSGRDARMPDVESREAGGGLSRFTLPPKVRSDLIEGRKLLESARKEDEPKKE